MSTIYLTDDIMRPDNGNGFPVDSSSTELYLNVNGFSFRWYANIYGYFFDKAASASNLNHTLGSHHYVFGKSSTKNSNLSLRIVGQLSENNFSSIKSELTSIMGGGYGYSGSEFYTYSRNYPNNISHAIKHIPSNETSGTYTYAFSSYLTFDLASLSISNKQIWVRIKVQYQNSNGNWVDCSRSSGLSVWKTYTTYAPFFQTITSPTHFYGNALNTFTASIASQFTSEITDTNAPGSSITNRTFTVVRNENPPYITSGTTTNYLYVAPITGKNDTYKADKYTFTVILSLQDPSDSRYMISVAKRTVSGNVEYLDTDDITSVYGARSWNVSDPTGMYEQYGVLLRNVANKLNLTVSAIAKYGTRIWPSYRDFGASSSSYTSIALGNSQTATVQLTIPETGTSATTGVKILAWEHSILLDETLTIPIINYSVPAFSNFAVHRCESDGTPNDRGAYCKIDWGVVITPIDNQNSKTLKIIHPAGQTEYNLTSYTQNGNLIVPADTEHAYPITVIVTDDLNSFSRSTILSTANVTMDWLYNGKGVGFGKVSSVESAVEIAESWKLIVYNMLFNNTDMALWMKQMLSRMDAIEQFASNIGSTTQFQATFYNDNVLLKRQWVRSGQSATAPTETPEKEPTTTIVYSFIGWAKTNGATSVDSTALTNITATRNIYAVFSSATRYYTVWFYNENELLQTSENKTYHSTTSFTGTTPSKSGYTFVGWRPSGRTIEQSTKAMAQFYDNSVITDSWKEIMDSVKNGTARTKYKPGQYKELDCGEFGKINMRIKGFGLNRLSGSGKKATIAWEGADCLNLTRRMNPPLQYTTRDVSYDDWTFTDMSAGYSKYRYNFQANGERTVANPGIITASVRCNGSGTFKIYYIISSGSSSGSNSNLTIIVNNETKYSGGIPASYVAYSVDLPCNSGTVFNIEIRYGKDSSSSYAPRIDLDWSGVTNGATISYTISTRKKKFPNTYTDNTGCIGGWKDSELRAWMNSTLFNAIDPIVRANIKDTIRCSRSARSDNTVDARCSYVPNELTVDKVCVPSYSELVGNTSATPSSSAGTTEIGLETQGVDFYVTNNTFSQKSRHGTTGVVRYWLRSVSIGSNTWSSTGGDYAYSSTYAPFNYNYYQSSANSQSADAYNYICLCFDT